MDQVAAQLQQINSNLEQFYAFYKSTSSGIDANTLITAIVGLIGVLVGAFISYYFSKRLTDSTNRARFAIQRKNILFSKLYKELLFFRKIIEELPKDNVYFELDTSVVDTDQNDPYETFYLDNNRYSKPQYKVWQEMKDDIRKTQIPKKLREQLDRLETTVVEYFNVLEMFINEQKKIEIEQRTEMIRIFQNERQANARAVFNIDFSRIFQRQPDIETIIQVNKTRFAFTNEDLLSEMRKIVFNVIQLDSRKTLIDKYDSFTKALDVTISMLDQIIQNIVDKYEYGDSLA